MTSPVSNAQQKVAGAESEAPASASAPAPSVAPVVREGVFERYILPFELLRKFPENLLNARRWINDVEEACETSLSLGAVDIDRLAHRLLSPKLEGTMADALWIYSKTWSELKGLLEERYPHEEQVRDLISEIRSGKRYGKLRPCDIPNQLTFDWCYLPHDQTLNILIRNMVMEALPPERREWFYYEDRRPWNLAIELERYIRIQRERGMDYDGWAERVYVDPSRSSMPAAASASSAQPTQSAAGSAGRSGNGRRRRQR